LSLRGVAEAAIAAELSAGTSSGSGIALLSVLGIDVSVAADAGQIDASETLFAELPLSASKREELVSAGCPVTYFAGVQLLVAAHRPAFRPAVRRTTVAIMGVAIVALFA